MLLFFRYYLFPLAENLVVIMRLHSWDSNLFWDFRTIYGGYRNRVKMELSDWLEESLPGNRCNLGFL